MTGPRLYIEAPSGWHEQGLNEIQRRSMPPGTRVFYKSSDDHCRLWVILEPPQGYVGWHMSVALLTDFINPMGGEYVPASRKPTIEEVLDARGAFLPLNIACALFWPPAEEVKHQHSTTWHVRQVLWGVPLPAMRQAQWNEQGMLLVAGQAPS